MSNSRKPRPRQPAPASRPASTRFGRWQPYIEQMTKVDEAERRGDAATAMALIEERLFAPDGKVFWRPWRILRLGQLELFGPWLPRWATSRWLIEQALQDISQAPRVAVSEAIAVAVEIQGGADKVGRPSGEDHRIKVIDGDWVFRQYLLYDKGRLASFLRRAPADLVAGADRIHEWARAPMRGFRLRHRLPQMTIWEDVGTGEPVETSNIGSAALVIPGECVIGRIVPIDDGRMFETVPLSVPEAVAQAVASEPGGWIGVLRDARTAGVEISTGDHRFGFLTDVAPDISALAVYDELRVLTDYPARGRALIRAAREELESPVIAPDEVDMWACIATEILHPNVFTALVQDARPDDADLFARLGSMLGEPAATFCRQLADGARGAA